MPELIPLERIEKRIYLIRGHKVMLDRDLAELYGVKTKRLNEQVSRNGERFPADFFFQLTKEETYNWRSQIGVGLINSVDDVSRCSSIPFAIESTL
jgi:hypothetical protein